MTIERLRITGQHSSVRAIMNLLSSVEGIEHVEEISDLMPHMDDADSSSAGLSDIQSTSALHEIEIDIPNAATRRKVHDAVDELAYRLGVLVEFEAESD